MRAKRSVILRSATVASTICIGGSTLGATSISGCGSDVHYASSPDDGGGDADAGASDPQVATDSGRVNEGDGGVVVPPNPCGDAVIIASEACDDGNRSKGDGCSASCQIETGWSCAGAPSTCETICGDGIVTGNETCDDESSCPGTCRRTLWSKRYGDTSIQQTAGLAVDATGAPIITGFYSGTVDFGGGPLTSVGIYDVFIAKLDAAGNHQWSRRVGGAGDDRVSAVATDSAGNVYVTGFFGDTIDFGGGALVSSGSWDIFVAKLDSAGKHVWSKRFGDSAQQQGEAVAIDAEGNVFVAGVLWGTVDFGGGALTSTGVHDMFVAKLDAAGNHVWSKRFGNTEGQYARGVAVNASGEVFVTGSCEGTIDFGGGPIAAIGEADGFLLALDAAGEHRWSKRWGAGNAYAGGASVTLDGSANVIVAGYAEGSADLGTGGMTAKGKLDALVGKFSSAGTPIFARRFGSPSNDFPSSIATDGSNGILVTGYYEGPIDFGSGPLTHTGARNTFITKLDASGTLLWSKGYGTSATGVGIATDATGNVFAAGYFTDSIDLGAGAHASAGGIYGSHDVFLAKLTP